MSEHNPWVSRPAFTAEAEPIEAAQTPSIAALGPTTPQSGIPAPERDLLLPTVQHRIASELWWLGTHGGSGESTLATLVPGWSEAGQGWPVVPTSPNRTRVVLVARSNARGLRTAQAAAQQWAAGMVPFADLLGLVVVADAPGRLPKPLRELKQLVSGGVPRMWTVPWLESVRLGESLSLPAAPREVRQMVDELRSLIR